MSWITIIWSIVASVYLTLALIHFYIWVRERRRYAYLLFSISALAAALTGFFELLMLHAQSVAQYDWAMYWGRFHRQCSRFQWFGLFAFISRLGTAGFLSQSLLCGPYSCFSTSLRRITGFYKDATFLGERFTQAVGKPNPWKYVGDAASALMAVFVVDVSVVLWRRGSQARAIVTGGTAMFMLLCSSTTRWRTLDSCTHLT